MMRMPMARITMMMMTMTPATMKPMRSPFGGRGRQPSAGAPVLFFVLDGRAAPGGCKGAGRAAIADPVSSLRRRRSLERDHAVAPGPLGHVHRPVGLVEQLRLRARIAREGCDSDAHRDRTVARVLGSDPAACLLYTSPSP